MVFHSFVNFNSVIPSPSGCMTSGPSATAFSVLVLHILCIFKSQNRATRRQPTVAVRLYTGEWVSLRGRGQFSLCAAHHPPQLAPPEAEGRARVAREPLPTCPGCAWLRDAGESHASNRPGGGAMARRWPTPWVRVQAPPVSRGPAPRLLWL